MNDGSSSDNTFNWLSMSAIMSALTSAMGKTSFSFVNQVIPLVIDYGVFSDHGYGAGAYIKDNAYAQNGRYYDSSFNFGSWSMNQQKIGNYSFSFVGYFS